jgi:hypothetical protein
MTLSDLAAIERDVRQWKSAGASSKMTVPITTLEQLIAAAKACAHIPHVLKGGL